MLIWILVAQIVSLTIFFIARMRVISYAREFPLVENKRTMVCGRCHLWHVFLGYTIFLIMSIVFGAFILLSFGV